MKKALMLVILMWLVLLPSSSFACSLCEELGKRGFSPDRVGKGIAEHFGGNLKISGPGKPFSSKSGAIFNLAADQNGKIFRVKGAENLRGLSFTGMINNNPVEIFVADIKAEEIGFVGLKASSNLLSSRQRQIERPAKNSNLASLSFEPASAAPQRQTTITPVFVKQTFVAPVRQTVEPNEAAPVQIEAEQIIEAKLEDKSTLMSPMDQEVRAAQEKASSTEQQVKQVTVKKKIRSQKYMDASVTAAAIVSGLAIPPPIGPLVAGGIILGRVGWGLFQSDPNDE